MPCTKLRFDLMLAKADSGKQSPYSPQKKARQGVRGGYPEGITSAAVVRQSRFSTPLRVFFLSFLLLFPGLHNSSNTRAVVYQMYNTTMLCTSTWLFFVK